MPQFSPEALAFTPTQEEFEQFGVPQIASMHGESLSAAEQAAMEAAYFGVKSRIVTALAVEQAGKISDLDYQATHNPVSGLPNERGFLRGLAEMRRQYPGVDIGIAAGDLDGFKGLNDTYGHYRGDAALQQVAGHFRRSDMESVVGNPHGDEFLVAAPLVPRDETYTDEPRQNLTPKQRLGAIVGRMEQVGHDLRESDADLRAVNFGMSAGGAILRPGDDPAIALVEADHNLNVKKQAGRAEKIRSLPLRKRVAHHIGHRLIRYAGTPRPR